MNRYDSARDSFTAVRADSGTGVGLLDDDVWSLVVTDSTVWMGSKLGVSVLDRASGGIDQYPGQNAPGALLPGIVMTMQQDGLGRVWASSFDGGTVLIDQVSRQITRLDDVAPDLAESIGSRVLEIEPYGEELWISSWDGLVIVDQRTLQYRTVPRGRPDNGTLVDAIISNTTHDLDGNAWIGTTLGLHAIRSSSGWIYHYRADPADARTIPHDLILDSFVDRSGVVWLATGGGGAVYFRPRLEVERIDRENSGLGNDEVQALFYDRDGTLWAGSRGGLDEIRLDDGNRVTNHDIGIVAAVMRDADRVLWAGTYNGLYRKGDDQDWKLVADGSSVVDLLPDPNVTDLKQDGEGRLWIGTRRGFSVLESTSNGVWLVGTSRDYRGSLPDPYVYTLYHDLDGSTLIGTSGGAAVLERYSDHIKQFDLAKRLQLSHRPSVTAFMRHENKLWIATDQDGLLAEDADGSLRQFTTANGLPSNIVTRLVEDARGRLWIITDGGMVTFDDENERFSGISINDEIWGIASSIASLDDGRLAFGGERGVLVFDPDNFREDRWASKVIITDLLIRNQPLEPSRLTTDEVLQLRHGENHVTIRFALADYSNLASNKYRYRFLEDSGQWLYSGALTQANYPSLSPGLYTFQVQGSNAHGQWSELSAVSFSIAKPFWEMWWFRFAVIGLVILVGYSIYRYRLGQITRLHRVRMQIADDLHDDIGSGLSSIALRLDMLQKQTSDTETTRTAAETATAARVLFAQLRDTVWLVDSSNDTLDKLAERMQTLGEQLLPGGTHRFKLKSTIPKIGINMETRRDVVLLYRELVANSIKHSHANRFETIVDYREGQFELSFIDDGRGFDKTSVVGVGRGLNTIETRTRRLGGQFVLDSSPGSGTLATLRFTPEKEHKQSDGNS